MSETINYKKVFNILVMLFSIGLLIYLCVSENGLINLVKNVGRINKKFLLIALLFQLLNLFIDICLAYIFIRTSVKGYRFTNAFKVSMVGQFFSAITPAASGGQPMQLYTLIKQGIDPGLATSALVQKFLVYQSLITAYGALAIVLSFKYFVNVISNIMWFFAIFGFVTQALVIIAILFFSLNKELTKKIIDFIFNFMSKIHVIKNPEGKVSKLEDQLNYFYKNNKELYSNKKLLIATYTSCFMQITCMYVIPYFIYKSFNLSGAGVLNIICSQAFVSMSSSFVPLPGASGASEGMFYMFFSLYFTQDTIKSAVLLWRLITYYLTILISAPFARLIK